MSKAYNKVIKTIQSCMQGMSLSLEKYVWHFKDLLTSKYLSHSFGIRHHHQRLLEMVTQCLCPFVSYGMKQMTVPVHDAQEIPTDWINE